MSGNLSDYAENKLLDHILGKTAFTMPSNVRIALLTTDPGEVGPGTEVSGGGYARQSLATSPASGGSAATSGEISFPQATADWGTVTHIALFDATTNGNMLWHAPLNAPKIIQNGDQAIITAGDLAFTLD